MAYELAIPIPLLTRLFELSGSYARKWASGFRSGSHRVPLNFEPETFGTAASPAPLIRIRKACQAKLNIRLPLPYGNAFLFGFIHLVSSLDIECLVKGGKIHQRSIYPPLSG